MKRSSGYLFSIYWLVSMLLYYITRQCGFVTDFYGWQDKFNHQSIMGAWDTFGWHANQQVSVFFFYILYALFGTNGWGWFLCFSLLHAANGTLLFQFFRRLMQKFSVDHAITFSFIGSALFLLSPFNAEVLVWKVCLLYLLSALLILIILQQLLNFLETGNRKFLWMIYGLLFLALFTFEIALVTPLLMMAVTMLWNARVRKEAGVFKGTGVLLLPSILLLGFYFLMSKLILHEWVPHYGADVHLNFSFNEVISKYFKYLLKYLLFLRYWSYPAQMKIFSVVENPVVTYALLTLLAIAFISFCVFFNRLSDRIRLSGLCLILFFIALTPVITLYMVTLLYGENDRYGYLASMFFWMMLVLLISFLPKKFFYGTTTALATVSVYLLIQTNSWWVSGNEVYYSLMNNFRWYDKDEVVVLNIPDNYRGLYMYRIYNEPSGLKEGLDLIWKKPYQGNMMEVTQFNMMTPHDGVSVKVDSINQLTVTFNQWGNWWWREGIGASDYSNDLYSVHFDGQSYHIHFKNLATNHAIIYQDGEVWKEVTM